MNGLWEHLTRQEQNAVLTAIEAYRESLEADKNDEDNEALDLLTSAWQGLANL